jgi:methionyl-tRNA formyltransferase
MRIIILTTEATHHTYFVREVVKVFPVEKVLVELKEVKAPFGIFHPYEKLRDSYEKDIFFCRKDTSLEDVCSITNVNSVNDPNSIKYLRELNPDIIIVFGTGKISSEMIQVCSQGIINLHGGDPEEYRGLDTHLWAIYHGDFASLITTLHHLNNELDDGDIILQGAFQIKSGMQFHELRRYNTEKCVELTLSAIDMYERYGRFISRPQRKCGRYYSFMPSSIKEICLNRFEKYISNTQ